MGRRGSDRMPTRKTRTELAAMRAAGRIVAQVLDVLERRAAPGVNTA